METEAVPQLFTDKLMNAFMALQRFTVVAELSCAVGQFKAFFDAMDVINERSAEILELVNKRKEEIEMAKKKNYTSTPVTPKTNQNNQGTKPSAKEGYTTGENKDSGQFKKPSGTSSKKKSKKKKSKGVKC